MDKITLDKSSFMALASESRIKLLKKLDERKMTVTELARELGISKPAILRHLDKLIEAGLVKKLEDKRKWVYYSLTLKGKNILHPERIKITLLLSVAFLTFLGGLFTLWEYMKTKIVEEPVEEGFVYGNATNIITKGVVMDTATVANPTYFYISLFLAIISAILIISAFYIKLKAKPSFFQKV